MRIGNLPFSGCAFFMGGLPENLIRRAQTDNGNCSKMLDDDGITALQGQLETIAFGYTRTWTDNSPAPSNLTAGSLPRVCNDIQNDFTNDGAVPAACANFVGPSLTWWDGTYSNVTFAYNGKGCPPLASYQTQLNKEIELTGPNSTTDLTCSFNTTSGVPSFPSQAQTSPL